MDYYENLYVGRGVTSKDVQDIISLFLHLFLIVGHHFSFDSTKKTQLVTFNGTCAQVVTRKQIIQTFVNFYIWWRDLFEGIILSDLKQGLCKTRGEYALLVLQTLVFATKGCGIQRFRDR